MTETDKQLIFELRVRGIGYKAVGAVLGINRDQVRQFCKSYGLEGSAPTVAINIREKRDGKELCANCYLFIVQKETGRSRRFCSEKCRRLWWKKHRNVNVKKAFNEEIENGI